MMVIMKERLEENLLISITKANQHARLNYVLVLKSKDKTANLIWKTVLFTDESSFNIYECDGRGKGQL